MTRPAGRKTLTLGYLGGSGRLAIVVSRAGRRKPKEGIGNEMATDTVEKTVTTDEPGVTSGGQSVTTASRRVTTTGPGGSEMARRVVVLLFGLVQILIGLRIVLLLLDAREANGLVSGILNLSQLFVAPFEGILRTDALHQAGSVLDVTAVVAFVGWTILEVIVIWAVGIFRGRQTT